MQRKQTGDFHVKVKIGGILTARERAPDASPIAPITPQQPHTPPSPLTFRQHRRAAAGTPRKTVPYPHVHYLISHVSLRFIVRRRFWWDGTLHAVR